MGKSGRAMLEALIAGETNPTKLASLAHPRAKASPEEFREALRGRVTKHHRFLLRLHLNQIDALNAAMATVDAQVEANLGPFRTAVELMMSIPGIKNLGANVIVSEIGIDMSRFPSHAHLISWAGICPRNDESAGKRRSTRLRKGAPWLKTTLVQCAWAAVKKKGSYLQAQFYRIKARRGPKKAIMAVAASILTAIYHMLKDGTMYKDLGSNQRFRIGANDGARAIGANAGCCRRRQLRGRRRNTPIESRVNLVWISHIRCPYARARGWAARCCSTCSIGLGGAAAAGRTIRW